MRFGRCKRCRKYKYLHKEVTCVTCLESESENNWVVLHVNPFTGRRVYRKGLTEKNAKELARKGRYLLPKEKS